MDWKPLLDPAMPYRSALRTATAAEARVAEARARFRGHVDALARLERAAAPAPAPEPATFGDVIAAMFGPGEVMETWRRWRGERAEAPRELERLERGLEDAQRQVSRVATWLDALTDEEAAIRTEMEAVRADVEAAAFDATLATDRARAVSAALHAIALARTKALPAEGAALDADAAVLEGIGEARAADARRFEAAAVRLGAVLEVGADALSCASRLRAALEQVHAEGTEVLHALDAHVSRMAAEARAADLEASLASGMEELRAAVGRAHLQARDGVSSLLHRLDRLAEAPDLLAPADPARAAAEAEVAALVDRVGRA